MAYIIDLIDDNPAEDEFVAPCGCDACDKWADCEYCSGCNPNWEQAEAWRREQQERAEQEMLDALPYHEWLDGR
jgi:hypothetical protein